MTENTPNLQTNLLSSHDSDMSIHNDYDTSSAVYHEGLNATLSTRTVKIEGLRKNYGETEILKGISVSMYEKQIFWYYSGSLNLLTLE